MIRTENLLRTMIAVVFILAAFDVSAQLSDPFAARAQLEKKATGPVLAVTLEIAQGDYIYADKFSVTASPPAILAPAAIPAPKTKYDKYLEKDIEVYDKTATFEYAVEANGAKNLSVKVAYQGCGPDICYPPTVEDFEIKLLSGSASSTGKEETLQQSDAGQGVKLAGELKGFKELGKRSGYLNSKDFVAFLDSVESGGELAHADATPFDGKGILAIIILVLIGGAALNLTPCVLPMIPINIAILGAGSQAKSKLRGLLLGATYGAGIAIAYGALGLLVILTGARFGALNSSPWFNFGIALLFIVLSLSMFGIFNIDFTRFQKAGVNTSKSGNFITAFVLGLVAALLAGACVAPVVISVLLYSTTLYANGSGAALLLPFLLGVGMALPWPFAGAGLSFLPRTGGWMEKVKYVFGAIILVAALYYGRLGYSLLTAEQAEGPDAPATQSAVAADTSHGWITSADKAIERSRTEGKPIFIDFWAEWCKSCLKMDKTTFKDPEVLARLDQYVKLKVDGDSKDADTAYLMDRFVDVGLPTYVIVGE